MSLIRVPKGLLLSSSLDTSTLRGNQPGADEVSIKIASRADVGLPDFDIRSQHQISNRSFTIRGVEGRQVRLPETTPISDQGRIGSCTAQRRMDGLELVMRKPVQLSRLDNYFASRYQSGTQDRDAGSTSLITALVVEHRGVCPEALWTYDDTPPPLDQEGTEDGSPDAKMLKRPTLMAELEGARHLVPEGAIQRIRGSGKGRVVQVKTAIDFGYPVGIDAAVGQDFCDGAYRDKPVLSPKHSVGGHAILVVGYLERSDGTTWFLIRNSWGYGFCNNGYCWFADSYVGDALSVDAVDATTMGPDGFEEAA